MSSTSQTLYGNFQVERVLDSDLIDAGYAELPSVTLTLSADRCNPESQSLHATHSTGC